jgi:hypothetical protein
MPRYFFHVMDGHASIDAEGTELNGIREARAQAVQTAGQILSEKRSAGSSCAIAAMWRRQ